MLYAVLIKFVLFLFFFNFFFNILSSCYFLKSFLVFSAIGSILYGSLGAVVQIKLKRFLAYTSISQSGYILLGLTSNTMHGFFSSFLYLIFYTLASLAFFLILLNLEHILHKQNIIYLNQLYSVFFYNKEITFHLICILFIMAAFPPFNSFFIKFFILLLVLEQKMEFLIGLILIISLISVFYYLNLIQQLLFFKINKTKIYLFNTNYFFLVFLRFCIFLFLLPAVVLSKIYLFCYFFITNFL